MDLPQSQDPIEELITNYNELNSPIIEELTEEPSPLEFMRFVARNTPFVVRGAAADWQATKTWTVDFLMQFLGDQLVNVAVTPAGNADAPTPFTHPDGTTTLVLAKPHEEYQPFSAFLSYLTAQEKATKATGEPEEVRYAQTQNDNLRHEYRRLQAHVPGDIAFARVALAAAAGPAAAGARGGGPDAVNLWIGNSRSVTALHRDAYENLYVQVAGRKHFTLLPPAFQPGVNERLLRGARYRRVVGAAGDGRRGGGGGGLELVLDEDLEEADQEEEEGKKGMVPFPTWDPDRPEENATRYSRLAQPMRVTLEPGDMLYLPCLWYHKVSQSCSPEGVCIAVNYWYDMDFTGPLYPLSTFVRSVSSKTDSSCKDDGGTVPP
ncbi:50e773cd-5d29-43ee-81db-43ecf6ad73dd [Thermothielavioides terrestris]|uniref:50e773cd-5d29-43ee-81db-43ecf6ad73dd n=1 Tax=Thermothielavioides terrestris TaxID=2587410 RepID=A0A3S4AN80_9PEZI|nr:50e773cd-5d29-43ee-81db-43ecf6ad73dd [Thermothielavioides terrestris]